ncbi:MAG: glycosyltransferase family 9 protein [Chthoniobacterales bacterium]
MSSSPIQAATFRHPRNLFAARLSEWASPILKGAASFLSRARPTPPASWRCGILLGADHIGDVLYNTASLPILAEAFPQCEWHYVASPPASDILANNPFIKSCVLSPDAIGSVDAAICYNSGGYWRDLIDVVRRGIPNRLGYVHKGFSALVTHPVEINYPQPYPAYFRDLVGQLTEREANWSLRPRIYPSPDDATKADGIWRETGFGGKPVVACFLTSRQAFGVWPARKFAEVVTHLEASGALQMVLCGTTDEADLLGKLKSEFALKTPILAGQLRLLELGCFLQKCAVVLCPDSGPRHLANAVRTPVVFVRNFAVGKIETGAYCETEIDAAPDLERVSPSEQEDAFDLLRPENVADLVRQQARASKWDR